MAIGKCKCGRDLKSFESCTPLGCQDTFLCAECYLLPENCLCENKKK